MLLLVVCLLFSGVSRVLSLLVFFLVLVSVVVVVSDSFR